MRQKNVCVRSELIVLGVLLGLAAGCGEGEQAPENLQTTQGALDSLEYAGECGELGMTDDEVCICRWTDFESCTLLSPITRFYSKLGYFNNINYNDRVASFIVGANLRMKACQDFTYRGICDIAVGVGGFRDVSLAHQQGKFKLHGGQISSIYIDWKWEDCMNPGSFQVALFKDENYNPRDCTLIGKPWASDGLYPNADYNADDYGQNGGFGWPHDSLSSIRVGDGVRVELYKESNYGGGVLRRGPGTRDARLAVSGFDNIISSIKVLGL